MTHRGPFQPLLFCDSVNLELQACFYCCTWLLRAVCTLDACSTFGVLCLTPSVCVSLLGILLLLGTPSHGRGHSSGRKGFVRNEDIRYF